MLPVLSLFVVIFAVFGSSQAGLSDDYRNHTRLDTKNESDPTFMLYWTYNKNESTISFAAEAKTLSGGWVGLGFRNKIDNTTTYDVVRGSLDDFAGRYKMEVFIAEPQHYGDIAQINFLLAVDKSGSTPEIIMTVDEEAPLYALDFHAVGEQTPVNDTQQNLMEKSVMKRDNTHVILKFKRLLDTKDSNDTVIKSGPMIVVWSYGNIAQLLSPATETGHKTVTLIPKEDASTSQTPTTTAPTVSKAGSCQVSWLLLALSVALFLVSGFSP